MAAQAGYAPAEYALADLYLDIASVNGAWLRDQTTGSGAFLDMVFADNAPETGEFTLDFSGIRLQWYGETAVSDPEAAVRRTPLNMPMLPYTAVSQ